MSNEQAVTNYAPSQTSDIDCDKCNYWRDENYMQCPKCLKRLRHDPAEFITKIIVATGNHKREYDGIAKIEYIDFPLNNNMEQLNQRVKEKFPTERYFLKIATRPVGNVVRLILDDGKVAIKTTQSCLLESTYPALSCLKDLVRPATERVLFIVESEYNGNIIYDFCLYRFNGGLINMKAIFEPKYNGVVDTFVAISVMDQQDRMRLKKYLMPM
ncbi:hypothetical protein F-M6_0248 [Faustovirus]|nr:hypothetical protein F-M6_0248 [Faustovirus]